MSTDPKQSDKTAIQNPASSPASLQPWAADYPAGGEIDLVDLGVLLWRRWRLMLTVFVIIAVLAILAAAFKHPSYEYTAGIRLGYLITSNGTAVPLVSSQSAVNALQNVYVPEASLQYVQGADTSASLPKITVTAGTDAGNSSTVMLTCRGAGKLGQACVGIEKLASQNFISDNSSAGEAVRATLQSQLDSAKLALQSLQNPAVFAVQKLAAEKAIADAKNDLASLKAGAQVLAVRKSKLEASADLLTKQAAQLQEHISTARKASIASAQNATSPTQAMSNLVLSTEVQQSVNLLNQTEQQLNVTLPQQLAGVEKDIADNTRAQALQNQTIVQNQTALQKLLFSHGQDIQSQEINITNLQAQITNIQDNKALGDPIRSVNPVGLGRSAIVGLGIVIGIILAIFAALFASYVGQVRERLRFTSAAGKQG